MDAREYLNRKGVNRDPDRPNTLEEKAWERARGSGRQRPTSGTPHDWEDWERHHEDLADGAEALEQKIDKDAHRLAQERAVKAAAHSAESAVEHFTPPPKVDSASAQPMPPLTEPAQQTAPEPAGLTLAYQALAILLPPLAIGLTNGGSRRVMLSAALTVAGWVPGAIYALLWIQRR
ncbi:unnamed protein product [Ectocarpus sp. 12 AP-2014]